MKCNECREALSAYYDKILDEKQKAEIADHLKQCTSCRNEYAQLKQMLSHLKETADEETVVPPLLHKQMLERVAKETQKGKVKSLWPQRIGGMVAALLVGVILIKVHPLELNEMDSREESYAVTAKDSAQKLTESIGDEVQPTQTEASDKMAASSGVAQARIAPEEQASAVPNIANQADENSNVVEDKVTVQSETSLTNEISQGKEVLSNTRKVQDEQIWEIEAEHIDLLTSYLETYAKESGATLTRQDEAESISFILYDIADSKGLFKALQTQSFTKSLIVVEETGKYIKIIVKA